MRSHHVAGMQPTASEYGKPSYQHHHDACVGARVHRRENLGCPDRYALACRYGSPSAINKQPWAFIVVTDEAKIAQLGDSLPYSRCSNHPAVAIIPCGDLSKAIEGEMAAFWINDVSAATENLLLAAHAMGLGAVWTGLHPDMNRVKMVQRMLELPEHIVPLCVVPVGVPAEQPEVKDKYNPDNIRYIR